MSTPDLNPAPSWGAVVPTQLRMLAQLQKRDFIVLGVITAVLVAMAVWGITQLSPQSSSQEQAMILPLLALPFALVAAFWPLGVWRRESPERRGYFWSLPAPRGPHTLVRVAMGWVLLMAACLVLMVVTLALAEVAVMRAGSGSLSLARWYVPLATATLAYVLVSSLAVLSDGPVRILVWTVVAVGGMRLVAGATKLTAIVAPIDGVVSSLWKALAGPLGGQGPEVVVHGSRYTVAFAVWGTHYLLWITLAMAALLFSVFRFRDAH